MQSQQKQKGISDVPGLALSLGICKAIYQENTRVISHMPISFYPYQISLQIYNQLKQSHYIWQKLFAKISCNREFLTKLAVKFCKGDPYMQRLLDIYMKTESNSVKIACSRVDYMGDSKPQLVQYNLMSVGLNGMSDRVQTLHNIIHQDQASINNYTFPQCKNQATLCKALMKALQTAKLDKGLVIMVAHQKQFNYGDHHAFKLQMRKHKKIVLSMTMDELIQKMRYDEATKIATLNNQLIGVFYFRTGYNMGHFPTQNHWKLRLQIQDSKAIKFPSIDLMLINSKRFQSELAKKQVLSQFISQQESNKLLKLAGQIYDFDDKEDQQIKTLIQKTKQESYVLKPNRQGGGNNFFGAKAYQKLTELYKQKQYLRNYILMKKIKSQTFQNIFISQYKPAKILKATAQFSTLGCFVVSGTTTVMNQFGGTLVRMKRQQSQQGGIAINMGVVSGICIKNYQK